MIQTYKFLHLYYYLKYSDLIHLENKYFFSYTDTKKNTWFFDIRSFKRLIDDDNLNPYTREPISFTIKTNATTRKIFKETIEIPDSNIKPIRTKLMPNVSVLETAWVRVKKSGRRINPRAVIPMKNKPKEIKM